MYGRALLEISVYVWEGIIGDNMYGRALLEISVHVWEGIIGDNNIMGRQYIGDVCIICGLYH